MPQRLSSNGAQAPASTRSGPSAKSMLGTVERAADVLMLFADTTRQDLGVTEIADSLQMSKPAVHRILTSLRVSGLIELNEHSRRYSLGIGAMRLGLAYLDKIDLRKLAYPELVQLSAQTQETATLSIRTGWSRVYVDQVTPEREVIMSVTLGASYPLHAGASSKAFLAFLPQAEIEDYLTRAPLDELTAGTITAVDALRNELITVRQQGWARSVAERKPGAASVAAPIFDHQSRAVGIVSVCGPAERFEAEFESCRDALLAATGRLSARVGGVPKLKV